MSKAIPLHAGEVAINHAPYIALDNKTQCIPQHYLRYQHDLSSVEALIQKIDYHAHYPIFVCQDNSGLYLQVGIIGYDNYQTQDEQDHYKIVYGRKWRIEPQLPSSEIIQTAFLAIKKAREHEVRELFRLSFSSKVSTPFNNHHDLPLLSHTLKTFDGKTAPTLSRKSLTTLLARIQYDAGCFTLLNIDQRECGSPTGKSNTQIILVLCFNPSPNSRLPELDDTPFTILLEQPELNTFLFKLMQHLIHIIDRQVDENFSFQGVNRFSWHNDIEHIGHLSIQTRDKKEAKENQSLADELALNNYETDKTRVPSITNSRFGTLLKQRLQNFKNLQGLLPSV